MRLGIFACAVVLAGCGPEPDTPLIRAARNGDLEVLRALLEAGADADRHDHDGVTALIMAAAYGNVDIVRMLLERGADPRARARGGITALSNAAGGGALFDITDGPALGTCNVETVRALVERDPALRLEGPVGGAMARWFRRGRSCEEVAALLGG